MLGKYAFFRKYNGQCAGSKMCRVKNVSGQKCAGSKMCGSKMCGSKMCGSKMIWYPIIWVFLLANIKTNFTITAMRKNFTMICKNYTMRYLNDLLSQMKSSYTNTKIAYLWGQIPYNPTLCHDVLNVEKKLKQLLLLRSSHFVSRSP